MSEGPQSGHDDQAGEEEGTAGEPDYPTGNPRAGGSGFGYPADGYTGHMSRPPAGSAPSGYERRADASPHAGEWGWGSPASESGGWYRADPGAGAGGWRWDDSTGGWRWAGPGGGAGGWRWDDSTGGWRWAGLGGGAGGWGWGDAPSGSGSWGGGNPPYGQAGGWGSPPWDSGIRRPRPPSRRGARIITALLAAALVAAIAGAGIGHADWRSASPGSPSPSSAGSPNRGSSSGSTPSGGGANSQAPTGGSPTGGPYGRSGAGGSSSAGTSGAGAGGSNSSGSAGNNVKATPAEIEAVGKKVSPSLVDINTTLSYSQEQAAGTGIVLTSTGEVLTNNHVINGETSIQVTDVGNGKTYNAKVVGYDHAQDIAVVQLVGASGLAAATLGNSSQVTTGQSVVAVGNAGGTGGEPSITGGSVTSLNQSITASDEGDGTSEQLNDLIQSNAPIQPGDSGGSLVDLSGKVVGVDTAASDGFSFQSGGQSTEGFSIPINRAVAIVRAIQAGQGSDSVHVGATAFLGVQVANANQGSASSSGSGATISQVIANGAAASAGLVAGDTITGFGGKTVSSSTDLTDIMEIYHPGQSASVNYVDSGGQSHTVTVTLASGPPS